MSTIFWMLALSHLLADYPLQTSWMVRAKRTWPGLTLHVSVHLVVLLLLAGPARGLWWPYLLLLATIHFWIDALKNALARYRPQWIVGPYVFDQFLHLLSLLGIAALIAQGAPLSYPIPRTWLILASGYLLATYVWFISERILAHSDLRYVNEVTHFLWPRLLTRGALLTFFLWIGERITGTVFLPLVGLLPLALLYAPGPYRRRAIVTDLAVALAATFLIQMAL